MTRTTKILACAFMAIALPALGADPAYRVAPAPGWVVRAPEAWLTAPAPPVAVGDSDYLLVDQQVRLDSATFTYERYAQRLTSQADVDSAAQISIDFDPGHEHVLLHEVRVLRAGRVVDKLSDARRSVLHREQGLEANLINGRETLHLLLQDVRVGDVLDYSYTTERQDPISERGYRRWFNTQWSTPVRHFRLRIQHPLGRELHVKDHGGLGAVRRTRQGTQEELLWEGRNIAALPSEAARPAWYFHYPRVEFSEFADWNAVRDWALPMYDVGDLHDPDLASLLAQIREAPDQPARILRALRFVQDEIRYTGIEVGAGAWRPNRPEVVLARRYGDCKDKVLLLVTLLRALDIPAWPALVHSNMRQGLLERLPSPGAFDHVIAKVRSGAHDYWLDATVSGQGGTLDSLVQADFGPSLVIRPAADGLEQMPRREGLKPTTTVIETFDFRQGTENTARMTVHTVYRDEDADGMRSRMLSQTAQRVGENYLEYYRKSYRRIRMTGPLEVRDERAANQFSLDEHYEIDSPFEKDDDGTRQFFLEAYLISDMTRKPEQTIRKSPLARDFPRHVRHEIVAYLPGEWKIEDAGNSVSDASLEYLSKVRFRNGRLDLTYDLRNKADHVPVSGLERFLVKLGKIRDDAFFSLTDGETAAAPAAAAAAAPTRTGPSLEMLTVLLLGLVLGVGAIQAFSRLRWRRPAAEPYAPQGLTGWLVLVVLGMVSSPFVLGFSLWQFFHNLGSAAQFQSVAAAGQPFVLLELLALTILLVLWLYGIWALFSRYTSFPYLFITLQVLAILALAFDACILPAVGRPGDPEAVKAVSTLVLRALVAVAWISYMLVSQRVRATFIVPPDRVGDDYRQRRVPAPLDPPAA